MADAGQQVGAGREVVGVFADAEALESAAHELLSRGFEHGRMSLLAGEKAIVEKLGHKYQRVEELEDNTEIPRVAYHSKEAVDKTKSALLGSMTPIGALAAAGAIFASGGGLAATLGVGLIGAEVGGFIGGVLGDFVENHHTAPLREQLEHGGLLLWVRTSGDAKEAAAIDVLSRHSGRDVHAHALPAAPPAAGA